MTPILTLHCSRAGSCTVNYLLRFSRHSSALPWAAWFLSSASRVAPAPRKPDVQERKDGVQQHGQDGLDIFSALALLGDGSACFWRKCIQVFCLPRPLPGREA